MAVCAFFSVFCMRDILLHWVDPFCIHGKESRIFTLRDYQTRRLSAGYRNRWANTHFSGLRKAGPMWRMRGDSGCLLIISVQNTNV